MVNLPKSAFDLAMERLRAEIGKPESSNRFGVSLSKWYFEQQSIAIRK
jgi:hypothetical protein